MRLEKMQDYLRQKGKKNFWDLSTTIPRSWMRTETAFLPMTSVKQRQNKLEK